MTAFKYFINRSFTTGFLMTMCVLASLASASVVHAETWPSRLIRATIPFGAGSATDVVPRLVFDRLAPEIGQPIVVENRPGAGGSVGTGQIAKADPDGYSILAHSSALAIAPAIFPDLSYHTSRDRSGVLRIGSSANVMIVPPSRPWKTVQEFIADAKAKSGAISFGSVGIGSAVAISGGKFRLRRPGRFLFLSARDRIAADPRRAGEGASGLERQTRRRSARRAVAVGDWP